jgi:peptide/nickel transport system substrate-binding protein
MSHEGEDMDLRSRTRRWRGSHTRVVAVAAALAATAALSACGGSSGDGGGNSGGGSTGTARRAESITIGANTAALSLDPAKNGNTADMQLYLTLAYEPLIKLLPDGSLGPGLATSWRYLDEEQKVFELTLRKDAKFSDGTPLTPQAVVDSIRHQKTANGPVAVYANAIRSARASGLNTVRLDLGQSNPTIALLLTQRFLIGDIIAPSGTAKPRVLGTRTLGAGPYMLDPKATVANDHYTFVPNPYYYDEDAIHFNRFTIRVFRSAQTALSALQSRQIALTGGGFTLVPAAESAGAKVTSALSAWYGVFLFDRNGELVRPLANETVRQALNYATDREGITQALFGTYGEPNSEPMVAGYQGFVPELRDHYAYDPAKARQLLAEAGYPDGFSMAIGGTNPYGNGADIAEAVADDWGKVGVKVDIKDYQDISALVGPWASKKLSAVAGHWDGQPEFIFAQQALAKDAGLYNPWKAEDAELSRLIATAYATTDPDQQDAAWAAVTERVVELGWFVPIASGAAVYFSDPKLQGVEISPVAFAQDPTRLHY